MHSDFDENGFDALTVDGKGQEIHYDVPFISVLLLRFRSS